MQRNFLIPVDEQQRRQRLARRFGHEYVPAADYALPDVLRACAPEIFRPDRPRSASLHPFIGLPLPVLQLDPRMMKQLRECRAPTAPILSLAPHSHPLDFNALPLAHLLSAAVSGRHGPTRSLALVALVCAAQVAADRRLSELFAAPKRLWVDLQEAEVERMIALHVALKGCLSRHGESAVEIGLVCLLMAARAGCPVEEAVLSLDAGAASLCQVQAIA